MVLVDTSVWVDFFHGKESARPLSDLMRNKEVLGHRWVLGEFMVGQLGPRRREILTDMRLLPDLPVYSIEDLSDFLEKEVLYGQGLSLVDLQLLYASILADCPLWTHDRSLSAAARHYGRDFTG